MFEDDLDVVATVDLLESAGELRALSHRAEARLLQHALAYADRYHPSAHPGRPGRRLRDGRERAVVLGGDGCPEVLEFAIAEFGVVLGVSPWVAADYLGQALGLRHRFPFLWARVLAGDATPWKACRIVADCRRLSQEAAARVDRRVAGLVDSITPGRLEKIIRAARMQVDGERARLEAAEKARERGVFVGRSNEHGTKTMFIKAAAGAVARNNAALAAIADALKVFGDTRAVQERRADAVGIIADSRFTEELLAQARAHRLTTPPPNNPAPDPATAAAPDPAAPEPATPDACGTPSAADPAASTVSDPTTSDAATPDTATGDATTPDMTAPDPTAPDSDKPGMTTPDGTPWHSREPKPDHAPDETSHGANLAGACAATGEPTSAAATVRARWGDEDDLLDDRTDGWDEPGPQDEADRDTPHPGTEHAAYVRPVALTDPPDPLDTPDIEPESEPVEPAGPFLHIEPDDARPMDAAAERALRARLAQVKHDAYTNQPHTHTGTTGTGATGTGGAGSRGRGTGGRVRPGQTEIYVHLTDHTLATGTGVLRAEGLGPMLAEQLAELVGYGPYTVKPVIDLNDAVSVDAYEIPDRIRERVKLTHPVEVFPYGTQEARPSMDLDHLRPYDPLGPPGQTSTSNLAPLGRYPHRVKTHAVGWDVCRVDHKTLQWTTPHGFRFHVDPTGTHRMPPPGQTTDK